MAATVKHDNAVAEAAAGPVYEIAAARVMLDCDVAVAFGTETKRVNEAVRRNPGKFADVHTFRLTEAQTAFLRSQFATTEPASGGRGGPRHCPRVFTLKGVVRLATILNTAEALRATDLVIDTFAAVYGQIADGQRQIALPNVDQFAATREDWRAARSLKRKMARALDGLLETLIATAGLDKPEQLARELNNGALQNVIERLRTRGLENAKLEADTGLVLAEAQKVLAEARRANAEAQRIDVDVLERKIAVVQKLMDLAREVDPVSFVAVLDRIETCEAPKLIGPS